MRTIAAVILALALMPVWGHLLEEGENNTLGICLASLNHKDFMENVAYYDNIVKSAASGGGYHYREWTAICLARPGLRFGVERLTKPLGTSHGFNHFGVFASTSMQHTTPAIPF